MICSQEKFPTGDLSFRHINCPFYVRLGLIAPCGAQNMNISGGNLREIVVPGVNTL
jgi:hypothetical protein